MAVYGRLDVYWPNGPIENYSLEKPEIAIGRLPGNDIVLDTTTLSRYHVKISHAGDQVSVTDLESINGTYIDGVRLAANETRLLKGGEEIQIGDIRMIFQPVIVIGDDSTAVVRPAAPPAEPTSENPTTPTTPVVEPLGFITTLADATITVTPGAHNQTHTDIQNISSKPMRYTIHVDGAPGSWARLERGEFELDPGARMPISISFKPARRSDSHPGDYPLTVRVAEKDNPAHEIVEPLLLKVRDFGGFGIAMASPRARSDGTFDAYVHNQGNTPLKLALSGADPADAFTVDVQPATLTLAPGERQIVRGQLKAKHPSWTGAPREQRFDLIARSIDAAGFQAAVSGKHTVKGRLPLWITSMLIPLIVGIGIIIVALGGAFVVIPALRPTATNTATNTATATLTNTATDTATNTATSTATDTETNTPTYTTTATFTESATASLTYTATFTLTSTFTASPTETLTFTPTATASLTNTPLPSPTNTPESTATVLVGSTGGNSSASTGTTSGIGSITGATVGPADSGVSSISANDATTAPSAAASVPQNPPLPSPTRSLPALSPVTGNSF